MVLTQATIKHIANLKDKKARQLYRECVVEGRRALKTVLDSKRWKLKGLYITAEEAAQSPLEFENYPYTTINNATMKKMSSMVTPPGYLGVFELPVLSNEIKPGIVLAEVQDPGNMGTIIRTALALKAPCIVVVQGADIFSPKVIQATAGTIAYAPLVVCTWDELLTLKKNIPLCALVVDNARPLQTASLREVLIVVGNEGSGIPSAWLEQCDRKETLPMPGNAESLNAAVAASIALYLGYNTYFFGKGE